MPDLTDRMLDLACAQAAAWSAELGHCDLRVCVNVSLHLRQIPLDSIKIDRAFTDDIDTNPQSEHFLQALLTLGHDLGLRVIVEGVERRTQMQVLRRIGATFAQGYLFSHPVPPADVHLGNAAGFSTS
jgi:EAL domain-containing protein (putative c-di-GMP-specific phosphodiesterase class I)